MTVYHKLLVKLTPISLTISFNLIKNKRKQEIYYISWWWETPMLPFSIKRNGFCFSTYLNPCLPEPFSVTCLAKEGWLQPPPWIFATKPPGLMILVLEDSYEILLSIPKKYQLPFIWCHNDFLMMSKSWKTGFYIFQVKIGQISNFCQNLYVILIWFLANWERKWLL